MARGLSLFEYDESREIERRGHSFYALIAAAMRHADTENMERLSAAFPAVAADLKARYNAPGGLLPNEVSPE